MTVELKIRWDGDAPGLQQHRLSVAAFGPALEVLLKTLRRIASNQITLAEDPDQGAAGGRLHKAAQEMDIEITGVHGGCVALQTVVTRPSGPNLELFDSIAENAVSELLSSIDSEKQGRQRNGMVRKFLKTLPSGINVQEYGLWVNGKERQTVKVGVVELAETPDDMPGLAYIVGRIVGVGFDPGRLEVRLLDTTEDARTVTCGATERQVERALALRHEEVRALVVSTGKQARLLWIRRIDESVGARDPEVHRNRIFGRWDGVLQRLAQ